MTDFPVCLTLPVQWAEMDALGHVNNTVFFRWFESARICLFEQVGLASVGRPTVGPILATTSCTFLSPVRFPATIVAGSRISRLGNTSFGMDYAVWLAEEPDAPVATGDGVVVLIDYTSGEKVPLPKELRARLGALQGAHHT